MSETSTFFNFKASKFNLLPFIVFTRIPRSKDILYLCTKAIESKTIYAFFPFQYWCDCLTLFFNVCVFSFKNFSYFDFALQAYKYRKLFLHFFSLLKSERFYFVIFNFPFRKALYIRLRLQLADQKSFVADIWKV